MSQPIATTNWERRSCCAPIRNGITPAFANSIYAYRCNMRVNPLDSYRWIIATGVGSGAAPAVAAQFVLETTALPAFNTAVGGASASDFSIVEDAGDIAIQYTPAPEPTGMLLLSMGASGLILRRRRKPQQPR